MSSIVAFSLILMLSSSGSRALTVPPAEDMQETFCRTRFEQASLAAAMNALRTLEDAIKSENDDLISPKRKGGFLNEQTVLQNFERIYAELKTELQTCMKLR